MSTISINNLAVVFTDDNGNNIEVIKCTDFFMNKSKLPLHSLEEDQLTVPKLITNMIKDTQTLFKGIDKNSLIKAILFDSIFASQLIKSSKPFKIAVLGSTDTLITYHTAQITGNISPESHIYYICNNISSNCHNAASWASCQPKMSFLYSDYENTGLESGCFDITIINGSALFNNHYDVISEARRITRSGGIFICLNAEDNLLDATFRLIFPEREVYCFSPSDTILTAVNNDNAWSAYDPLDISAEYEALLQQAEAAKSCNDEALLRKLIANADALADEAIKRHDTELKIKLISIKELLINLVCRI